MFPRIHLHIFLLLFTQIIFSQSNAIKYQIIGSAFLDNCSYEFLQRLSDEAGGRLVGSAGNKKAVTILSEELSRIGLSLETETFSMPGWVRGDDRVIMLSPVEKKLHATALGYVNSQPAFQAEMIYAEYGFEDTYHQLEAKGKIVLVESKKPPEQTPLLRQEAIAIAAGREAKAILFINAEPGAVTQAGSGDFQGYPTPIPAFSLTYEEGNWLKRLLEKKQTVRMQLEVKSSCLTMQTENLIVRLPGRSKKKIVVGAHYDSWDLAQGSIDNGLGTAILLEVTRLLSRFSPTNHYSVEFVWFNGEELGLFGAKDYAKRHASDDILSMFNMDMTGYPIGFNAMGFDEFVPLLKELVSTLKGFDLSAGVISRPWTNSDHMPFLLKGIPTLSLQARLDENMLASYHNTRDSFDKVNKKYLSEAAAVVSILIYELANRPDFQFSRKNEVEIISMLKSFGLDEKLKKQKEWPFPND